MPSYSRGLWPCVMRHRLAAVELCKSGVDPMVLKLSERSRMIAELGITGARGAGDGTIEFRLRHGRLVSHCNSPGLIPEKSGWLTRSCMTKAFM